MILADTHDDLRKMAQIQKDFVEMYGNDKKGLVAVNSYYVHLTDRKFRAVFGIGDGVDREQSGLYIKLSAVFEGVKFVALFTPRTPQVGIYDMPLKGD